MEVTIEMLQAAMRKATEAGLLPRNSSAADRANSMEIMRTILQAALDALPAPAALPASRPFPFEDASVRGRRGRL